MWSVAEAGPSFVNVGVVTEEELARQVGIMQAAIDDPGVIILAPRMSLVWARKGDG